MAVGEFLDISQRLIENFFPVYGRIQMSGAASARDLATALDTTNESTYRSFALANQDAAKATVAVDRGNRLDVLSVKLGRAGLADNAFMYYGDRQRPYFNLHNEMRVTDILDAVDNILEGRNYSPEIKGVIMRSRVFTMLTAYPEKLAQTALYFMEKGLTVQEKSQALESLHDLTGESFAARAKDMWNKTFKEHASQSAIEPIDKEPWFENIQKRVGKADLSTSLMSFQQSLWDISDRIKSHEAGRDNRWGRDVVDENLALLEIPHSSEELLVWATSNLASLTGALDEVAALAGSGLTVEGSVSAEKLLDDYRLVANRVVSRMVSDRLIPPIPDGDTYEIQIASPEMTRYFPKGYMSRPGYHEHPKNVRIYLPDPAIGPDISNELAIEKEIFAVHEVGAHALQQFYRECLPEFVTNSLLSVTLGLEGHAFSTELAAFEEGSIDQSLTNFFAVLRGRQHRAARAVFALTYHLSRDIENIKDPALRAEMMTKFSGHGEKEIADILVGEYSQSTGMDPKQASDDAGRGMENPFWLFSYYVGAAGAETYIAQAQQQGLTRKDALRLWVEHGGAHLPAHFQAYKEGWITDAGNSREFNWLVPDRAVELWKRHKQTGSFSSA